MAVGIGATDKGVSTSTLAVSTVGVATAPTGSAFYVTVFANGANGAVAPTITDNKGNAGYTAIGAQFQDTNSDFAWRFVAPNVAGGAGTIITATFAAAPTVLAVCLVEMTGCALSSIVDQSNTGTSGASTGPATSGNITITPPAAGDVLVGSVFVNDSSGALTFTEANGFTIQQFDNVFATRPVQWAVGTRVVTAANTYSAAYSWGGANLFTGSFIDSFKGAASGGGAMTGAVTRGVTSPTTQTTTGLPV